MKQMFAITILPTLGASVMACNMDRHEDKIRKS